METKGLDCLARIYISIGLITKNYIMENIEIFEKHFRKGMSNKDFASFKRTHPTLLKVVTRAMEEVENGKTPPQSEKEEVTKSKE